MPAASLTKVDTTSQSWLVLPKTQGITGYRCVCLSRAAQLQSWGLAVSLVSLSQACCLHRRPSCATSAFCAIEAVHRKVCWLTCCVRKDRRLNTDLRFALAPKLVPVAGPTVTYGPYCMCHQTCWLAKALQFLSPSPHVAFDRSVYMLLLVCVLEAVVMLAVPFNI